MHRSTNVRRSNPPAIMHLQHDSCMRRVKNMRSHREKERVDAVARDFDQFQPDLKELGRDLSAIKSVPRLMILGLLNKIDGLSFKDLAVHTRINESNLAYHVMQLKKHGFITNEMRADREDRCYSFYHVSQKGKKYMDFLEQH